MLSRNYHLNKIENFIRKKHKYSKNNPKYLILYKDLYHFKYVISQFYDINKNFFKHFIRLVYSILKHLRETHRDENWIFYFKIKNIFYF